jgi:2-keto-4-pentenoate hydratase/2-oxohepta-3-ene-1,7-dioic acid hydratase in catechol pathway
MKLCRFDNDRLGVVQGDVIRDVTQVLEELPRVTYPLPRFDPLIANLPQVQRRIEAVLPKAATVPLAKVRLLSPIANPGKIMAAPVNYKAHLQEVLDNAEIHHQNKINEIHRAGIFLKATSSLVGPAEGVALNYLDRRNDHEIELVAVIGKTAKKVSRAQALQHIAGYTIGLDMTIRGPEERSFRKSGDSYTVLGPWFVTADEIGDIANLGLALSVNGEVRQQANTRDLILGVAELIEFASSFYTLQPGDVLMTGTPEGVGPVKPGDVMVARIDRIGEMRVEVRAG